MRMTRSDLKRLAFEMPIGDPFGGPAFGRKEDFIFGGGESAPAPQTQQVDPVVGQAMMKQAETADRVAKQSEERQAKYDPILMDLANQQAQIGKDNAARSSAQWESYRQDFQPIEKELAKRSMEFATPQRAEANANVAAADVRKQIGLGVDQFGRDQGRLGVGMRPGSEGANARMFAQELGTSAAAAGASNNARTQTEMTGLSMLDNASKFGRNMPSTGIAADQLSLSGANSAGNTIGNANSMALANGQAALPWYQGAAQTGIGIANANNNATIGAFNASTSRQQADNAGAAGFGQLLGTLGGAAIKAGMFGSSSKEVKEDKAPINDAASLEMVKSLPVEKWKYKDGVSDSGEHIGPYAEDVHAALGDAAAPGGKMLDMVTMNGLTMSAIKALDKKVTKLTKEIGLGDAPRKMVQTKYERRAV